MTERVRAEHAERVRDFYREQGAKTEQKRIINLLLDLNVVRRCAATNKLVAVTTNMEEVVYLTGFENA
jgi:adenylosuccinate synthase